MLKKLKKL